MYVINCAQFLKMKNKIKYILRVLTEHLHIVLYFYFWLGIFIGGLVAPQDRVEILNSDLIKEGWHLSMFSMILIFPVFIIYYIRVKKKKGQE